MGLKYWFIKSRLKKRKPTPISIKEIEQKHKNPDEELFNDSSYFNGIGKDGSYFFVRQSFRTTRGNEYWLELFLPDYGLFRLKNHPGEEGEGFQLGKLKFDCLEEGKKWKISFEGEMSLEGNPKMVEIDLIFNAKTPVIDFQNALIVEFTAKAISEAKWSKSFFEKLKDSKKMHFEQGGEIIGTVKVEDKEFKVKWDSLRDHSWGIRKWGGWNRHVWICGMMEDGNAFNLSMVKYDYMGQLSAGFITDGDQIHYLREFPEIEDFAKNPIFPEKLNLNLKYSNGKDYNLNIERKAFVPYDMDGEYRINEGVSSGTVNGVKVNLVSEFGFNSTHYDI